MLDLFRIYLVIYLGERSVGHTYLYLLYEYFKDEILVLIRFLIFFIHIYIQMKLIENIIYVNMFILVNSLLFIYVCMYVYTRITLIIWGDNPNAAI
jgi:hypothetical protein